MAVAVASAWLITVPQRKVRFILVHGFRWLSLQLLVPADAGSVVMKITIIAMGTPQRLLLSRLTDSRAGGGNGGPGISFDDTVPRTYFPQTFYQISQKSATS